MWCTREVTRWREALQIRRALEQEGVALSWEETCQWSDIFDFTISINFHRIFVKIMDFHSCHYMVYIGAFDILYSVYNSV